MRGHPKIILEGDDARDQVAGFVPAKLRQNRKKLSRHGDFAEVLLEVDYGSVRSTALQHLVNLVAMSYVAFVAAQLIKREIGSVHGDGLKRDFGGNSVQA